MGLCIQHTWEDNLQDVLPAFPFRETPTFYLYSLILMLVEGVEEFFSSPYPNQPPAPSSLTFLKVNHFDWREL